MVENCFRKIMFVVNEMESFCKEYIQLKKIKLRTIIGGFGSLLTDSFINGNRPLLTDKVDY